MNAEVQKFERKQWVAARADPTMCVKYEGSVRVGRWEVQVKLTSIFDVELKIVLVDHILIRTRKIVRLYGGKWLDRWFWSLERRMETPDEGEPSYYGGL